MPIPGVARGPLRPAYDAVIVGAGIQGLALAYELSKRAVGTVAVLEADRPGVGASGRNGQLIRSAFSSREWTQLFDLSLRRWRSLSAELDFDVEFTEAGYLVLASTEEQLAHLRLDRRNQLDLGLRVELLGREAVASLAPCLAGELVCGALFQPDAGFGHHDAALWGYAQAAARGGVEVHSATAVTDVRVRRGRVAGVVTDQGEVATEIVVDAAGAFARELAAMAGVELPTQRYRLEILATEPLEPFLRPAVASLELFGYCHQTPRGEFVGGTEFKAENPADDEAVTLEALRDMAVKFVRLIPRLASARVIRHWAGLVDRSADVSPVLGPVPEVEGFYLDCGWTYGFMGAPGTADLLARAIVEGAVDPILKPFGIERLRTGRLIEEGSLVIPSGGLA